VIIFELQMSSQGIFIKRFAYNISQVLALVGGMKNVVFAAIIVLSEMFRKTEALGQIIEAISSTPDEAKKFNKFSFQVKLQFHRIVCCGKKRVDFG
jgi:hypothetical protein